MMKISQLRPNGWQELLLLIVCFAVFLIFWGRRYTSLALTLESQPSQSLFALLIVDLVDKFRQIRSAQRFMRFNVFDETHSQFAVHRGVHYVGIARVIVKSRNAIQTMTDNVALIQCLIDVAIQMNDAKDITKTDGQHVRIFLAQSMRWILADLRRRIWTLWVVERVHITIDEGLNSEIMNESVVEFVILINAVQTQFEVVLMKVYAHPIQIFNDAIHHFPQWVFVAFNVIVFWRKIRLLRMHVLIVRILRKIIVDVCRCFQNIAQFV
mmetsp:Transcript_53965/g.89401  ORF Transcript_53965/g.89401 Transcript_53965/m.89401 type:complete len:268 (+) Transcript_53965:322-1125(+)